MINWDFLRASRLVLEIKDVPFPNDFRQTCKKILSRLFRIFVHIYIHHFEKLVQIGACL
uniref:Uncharacterized protein n=1 Tax=Meloidogyne incognita TaxID=6306 RepID=A0A914M5D8_MELIC